jgi:uncharacterized DUF497 family protein
VPQGVYIAVIDIRPGVEDKIRTKHNLTGQEVRNVFIMNPKVRGNWEDHPDYGRRYVAVGSTETGRLVIAWFYDIDASDGVWDLGTARYV